MPAGPSREAIVRVRGLGNRFGEQIVHQGLDLDVYRGEVLGVVGGSGSGKSVLLRTIVGLHRAAAGTVEVFGQELDHLDEEERRALERRWGVLFQSGALFSSLSVLDNVALPLKETLALPAPLRREIARLKLGLVGLPPEAGAKLPSELSGGMKKRAGLARALALDPELLFLDEPTAGLDPIGAAAFDQLIAELVASLGLTVFLVTHDLDSLAAICDRIAVLGERKVLAAGTLDELLASDHPWLREYFHGPRGRASRDSRGQVQSGA
jgi:phospholipid/cholesterol/gamma-HCH transport system ATP-binding protein